MLFAGYYLALMLLLYSLLLELNVRRWLSGLAVLLLMLSPIIFRHATIGYANLPTGYYLVAGIGVFILLSESNFNMRSLLLSSLLLVCAAWTRPEGLNLAFGAVIILLGFILTRKFTYFHWKQLAIFLIPMIFYLIFWQIIKAQIYTEPFKNSDLFSTALSHITQCNLHLEAGFYILTYLTQELLTFRIFGGVGLMLLILALLVTISRKNVPRSTWMLITVGGLWIVMIVGMYYLLSFSSTHDLSWWVTSGLNRMVFPGIILLWLGMTNAVHNILVGLENNPLAIHN
jgi:hypothetical protein